MSEVLLGPASFVCDDLLKRADWENLAGAMEMASHAPTVLRLAKVNPSRLERSRQAPCSETAELCIESISKIVFQ